MRAGLPGRQFKTFGRRDAKRLEIEVEQKPLAIPDRAVFVAGDDPPWPLRKDAFYQFQIKVY